jgi:hypothetical protein
MGKHAASVITRITFATKVKALAVTAAVFGAAIALSLSTVGGTYALMNSSLIVNAGTIVSGSATLTIENASTYAIPGMNASQLLPGRSVISAAPVMIKNTGTVPLLVTMGTVTFQSGTADLRSNLQFAIKQTATCTITPDGTAFPTSSPSISLAVGQSLPVCLEVGLRTNAPANVQGESAAFTVPFTATQVRP